MDQPAAAASFASAYEEEAFPVKVSATSGAEALAVLNRIAQVSW